MNRFISSAFRQRQRRPPACCASLHAGRPTEHTCRWKSGCTGSRRSCELSCPDAGFREAAHRPGIFGRRGWGRLVGPPRSARGAIATDFSRTFDVTVKKTAKSWQQAASSFAAQSATMPPTPTLRVHRWRGWGATCGAPIRRRPLTSRNPAPSPTTEAVANCWSSSLSARPRSERRRRRQAQGHRGVFLAAYRPGEHSSLAGIWKVSRTVLQIL